MNVQTLPFAHLIDHPLVVDPSSDNCVVSTNPATGQTLGAVKIQSTADYEDLVKRAQLVQKEWRMLPAPKRGEIVRRIGNAFREEEQALGALVTMEMGKIYPEGVGEVVECIDIADFAVGLSRQLYGLTMTSERPQHRMYEQWHPLGTIGIITAFNFPVAVWAWNAMLAAVCGNSMIWKPSLVTPLCAVAMTNVAHRVMKEQDIFKPTQGDPCDLFGLIIGTDDQVGETMIADRRLPLISATGSCRMGRHVGTQVAKRLGRSLLELGGNNAIIITESADLDLVLRGVLFGAVGTAGQRCTSTRRLFCHSSVVDEVASRLVKAYEQVPIGDPMADGTLVGPLINEQSVANMRAAITSAGEQGCDILCGGVEGIDRYADDAGHYVTPTIVRVPAGSDPAIARDETFAPVLYIYEYSDLDEAIEAQNSVDQGLSSAIFTDSMRQAERFLSHNGSDCGIANVNIGTSGAEIGGAFGGEKDTGGGRESGSDSWRQYMRRQTCTLNWGDDVPLAQGIEFG
ncbi:MAG: aldehyde dehydrogenase family protein [Phycisphaerae bacterium]|nr:aldehyde dehydrogenase family protein [Phycisphaerae bacterium]|tara:strand:- start:148 stop:1689 length:1542 start_codon:yes stop_codon:yes gene_type:complete